MVNGDLRFQGLRGDRSLMDGARIRGLLPASHGRSAGLAAGGQAEAHLDFFEAVARLGTVVFFAGQAPGLRSQVPSPLPPAP